MVDYEDAYFNWLIRLAFERLGVVTATIPLPDSPGSVGLVRDFDIVLSSKSFAPGTGPSCHRTTAEWWQGVLASTAEDEEPKPEKRPDDAIRIVLTSGTTGTPKRMLHTRHTHDTLIMKTMCFAGFTRSSRYLVVLPLAAGAPTACIRAGGTVVFSQQTPLANAITTHAITHTMIAPSILQRALDELPAGFAKPADLTVLSLGAALSRVLREKTLSRLATNVCDIYGSNEAGFVSLTWGTREFGTIWPGTRVEIVDDRDRPLPFGQVGHIRVQTDCMVHGYLDYPEAAGRIFKDGWFYAGDLGILHDEQRLQVIGRSDDVLNLGWRKIAPELIEGQIVKTAQVGDVGVCSVQNADGIEELCIAVSSPRDNDEVLLQRITQMFRGLQLGQFRVIKVASIPRTATGKIQRDLLKEIVAAATRGH
ncbi:MAG TPA: fatty acid--CoA ligase family protein [Stellaceae bacterium]|nr:fatty acid--CoA ligase family protein [Stellaceae bacterium]